MRSYIRIVLLAVVSQAVLLSGCGFGPSSSSNEAVAPPSFAPPPTKKRPNVKSTGENTKHMSRIETATPSRSLKAEGE